MRLINTKTIQLHEFFDDQIPLYVILSHRWEGAEVTFQDLSAGKGIEMKGDPRYAKILGCCMQAREDGFEFAWVDSCCIDKTSSAELSEAINSMFQWYQEAQMCYAYLSDVPGGENLDHYREDSEFRRSKWFTRGWTLQELLAPGIVIFYNHDWLEIGTKASMSELISSITHIGREFLNGTTGLRSACVAQKMSWASLRTTTRSEDTAYCLMGLFDVNMPLLYGERGEKAFYRLQLEIIRNSSDESIFAWGEINAHSLWNVSMSFHCGLYYSLLAEHPRAFHGSRDIVEEFSFRPPYTMTNKGLQIMVNLVSPSEYMASTEVLKNDGKLPVWVLILHCRRRGENSGSIAIYLTEDKEGLGWVRLSDSLLFSLYSKNREYNHYRESDGFKPHQIIIQTLPGFFDAILRRYAIVSPISLLLDIRSVIKYGYSVYAWIGNGLSVELGKAGVRFEHVHSRSRLFLQCTSPQEGFRLVLTRQARLPENRIESQIVGFSIFLDGDEAGSPPNDRVLLPSGKVAKLIVKRKVESGNSIYVLQVLIEPV